MNDLRGISSNWFKNQFCPSWALGRGITVYCAARFGMEIWNRPCAPDLVKPEIQNNLSPLPDPLANRYSCRQSVFSIFLRIRLTFSHFINDDVFLPFKRLIILCSGPYKLFYIFILFDKQCLNWDSSA
jgi:hypothetical protein